jgi:hypothetical protein
VTSRHVRLIAGASVKHGVRSGTGLVYLVLTVMTGLIVAQTSLKPAEVMQDNMQHASPETLRLQFGELVEQAKPAVKWFTGASSSQIQYLTTAHPAILSATWIILLFLVPCLVAFGSFNQLSGDVQHKGVRYLLLRTDRASLFLGRLVGTYFFTLLVFAVVVFLIAVYTALKVRFYGGEEVLLWSARALAAMAIVALPYVALAAWISASVDSPLFSLVLGQLAVWIVPLVVDGLEAQWPGLKAIGWIAPWRYKYFVLFPEPAYVAGGVAACVGFAALFTWLGLRKFETRDL